MLQVLSSCCSAEDAVLDNPSTTTNNNNKDTVVDSTTSTTGPSQEETIQLEEMLRQLSREELEVAAQTSYEYFQTPDPFQRNHYAKVCALRYLRSKNGNLTEALAKLQTTLAFRTEIQVNELRTAFDTDNNNNNNNTSKLATRLEQELRKEILYVQGYDKQGHSTYIFVPRNVLEHASVEWTIQQHVYTLERAVAASRATDQTVNAVVDFKGFSWFRNAPPREIGQAFLTVLRNHYVGQVHQIYIVDPPQAFWYLWKLFQPFVGTKTRDKIHLVQSSSNELAAIYDKDQAASWMMSSGTKNRPLNVEEYLFQTPFDRSFDDDVDETR